MQVNDPQKSSKRLKSEGRSMDGPEAYICDLCKHRFTKNQWCWHSVLLAEGKTCEGALFHGRHACPGCGPSLCVDILSVRLSLLHLLSACLRTSTT